MNKFKMTIAALTMASLLLTGCSKDSNGNTSGASDATVESVSTKTPAEKTAELMAQLELPEMAEVSSDMLLAYYGVEKEDVKEMSAYRVGSGAFPDQFGIFVAVDAAAAERVKTCVEAYVESERNSFMDYTPNEMYKFEDCFVKISDTTVYYAVCADNAKAETILR
ncbi:MAG: DUF4358 domain-containing protein [Oscillospiraceae bacterium]